MKILYFYIVEELSRKIERRCNGFRQLPEAFELIVSSI